MASKKSKVQPRGVSKRKGIVPSDGASGLLNELKTATALNQFLILMLSKSLELQHLTERAHHQGFRADVKPALDRAANLASAGLADIAAQDIDSAKRNLRALDLAVHAARASLIDEMLLEVRGRVETIDKVWGAGGPLLGAGFLLLFPKDGELIHIGPVRGQVEFWCKIALAPYAKAGFYAAGFFARTATGPTHFPNDLKPKPYKVKRALPDNDDNYPFGAETHSRLAALVLCGAGVTQLNDNNDAYSGDPANEMRVMLDERYLTAATGGFWLARSPQLPREVAGYTISPA
jgi:hypothetical protein